MNWIFNMFKKASKEEASEQTEKEIQSDLAKDLMKIDEEQIHQEEETLQAGIENARGFTKEAAYEKDDTSEDTVDKDYKLEISGMSDYNLAEILAEAETSKKQSTTVNFNEEKEKQLKAVKSDRSAAEKKVFDLVKDHSLDDWKEFFKKIESYEHKVATEEELRGKDWKKKDWRTNDKDFKGKSDEEHLKEDNEGSAKEEEKGQIGKEALKKSADTKECPDCKKIYAGRVPDKCWDCGADMKSAKDASRKQASESTDQIRKKVIKKIKDVVEEELDDKIVMDKEDAVDEHERLTDVLESPSHEDDKEEAEEQKEELEDYKQASKKKKALWPFSDDVPSADKAQKVHEKTREKKVKEDTKYILKNIGRSIKEYGLRDGLEWNATDEDVAKGVVDVLRSKGYNVTDPTRDNGLYKFTISSGKAASKKVAIAVPKDHPVQPLKPGEDAEGKATCNTCGLSWDDEKVTSMTPAPSARCPFEAFHEDTEASQKKAEEEEIEVDNLPAQETKDVPEDLAAPVEESAVPEKQKLDDKITEKIDKKIEEKADEIAEKVEKKVDEHEEEVEQKVEQKIDEKVEEAFEEHHEDHHDMPADAPKDNHEDEEKEESEDKEEEPKEEEEDIAPQASKKEVLKKVAEIESPWQVVKNEQGEEIIARVAPAKTNKVSKEKSKSQDLK